MNKKAQVAGQVFIFILAAVLAILIIIYGFNAISGFIKRTDDIAFINFKTALQSETRKITSAYGSVKRLELALPGQFQMLCFIDLSASQSDKDQTCLCNKNNCNENNLHEFQPEVCDAWETEGNEISAYLVPTQEIKLTPIEIDSHYLCILPRTGNKINLRLEGAGDKTKISEWQ